MFFVYLSTDWLETMRVAGRGYLFSSRTHWVSVFLPHGPSHFHKVPHHFLLHELLCQLRR
jgi:hypothetical protein